MPRPRRSNLSQRSRNAIRLRNIASQSSEEERIFAREKRRVSMALFRASQRQEQREAALEKTRKVRALARSCGGDMVHRSGSACFSPQRSPNVSGPDMNLIKEPEPDCLPLKDAGRLPNDDPLQDSAYTANYLTPVLVSKEAEPLTDKAPIATANTATPDNVADSNQTSPGKTICRSELSLRCRLPLNKLRRILHKIRPMKRNINSSTNIVPKNSAPAVTDADDVVSDVVVSDASVVPSAGSECDKLAEPSAVDEVGTKMKTKTGVLTVGRVLCLYCDRSFVTASLQHRHVQRVHRENPGRRSSGRTAHLQAQGDFNGCGFCSETATARSTNLLDLFAHLLDKHADKYFACRKCVVRFTTSENLNIHLSDVHGQSVDLKVVMRNSDIVENVAGKSVRNVNSPELQVDNVNAIDFEQNIAVNILSMGIAGPIEHKTNPKIIVTESSNSPQTKVSQKPQKIALNNSAQEQDEPMLSRLGITQNRSPGSKKTSKMRKTELKASLNDKKIKLKPDIQEFSINKNINSKNELFDSRFDKNFYENVSKNVCENLSNYLDGKISNIPGMSGSDSGFVSPPTLSFDNENRVRIHESNSSLTTISSFPTLLSSEQYGAIGPPNNPKLPRKKATKNSWKWKFDFVKKYKYYNENGKMVKKVKPTFLGTRDLSKLDMWTQLTMRNKYDLEKSKDKRNNEEEQTECDERKEKLRLLSELNSILDTRLFPKLNLEQECSPLAIKKETESHKEKSENEVKFTRRKSCRINDICASLAKVTASNLATKTVSDDNTLDSIRNNKQNCNLKENTSVSLLDCLQPRIDSAFTPVASTSSSSEVSFSNYLNLKPKTNIPNGLNSPEVYLSGEWERPRCYICVGCGLKLNTLKELEDHKSSEHPHIFSTYYEIVGKEMINSEVYKLFHLPGAQNTGKLLVDIKQNNGLAKGLTGDSVACTKCSKTVALSERFRHMLECSGDSYLLAKKKSRYRPFGSRSRRRKARLHGCKVPRRMPTTAMKKIRRNTKTNIPRSKPSDAETIQRMLANLPAKRLSKHIVPLPRPRQHLKKQVQVKQKTNVQQPKIIPGNRHLLNNRASRSRTFLQAGSHKPTWTELQRLKNSKQTRNARKTTMSKRNIKDDVDIDSDVDVETVDAEESTETDTESGEVDVETVDSNPVFIINGGPTSSNKKIRKTSKTVLNKSKKNAENTKSTSKINMVENNNKMRQAKIKTKTDKSSQDNIKKASLKNSVLPKTAIHILDIEHDKVDKNSTKKLSKPKHNIKGKSSTIIDVTDHKKNKSAIDVSKQKSVTKMNSKKKVKVNASAKIEFDKNLDREINVNTENISAFEPIDVVNDILPVQEAVSSVGALIINSNSKIKMRSKRAAKGTEKTSLKEVKTTVNKSKSAKKSNTDKRNFEQVEEEKWNAEKLNSVNNIAKYDPDSDSKSDDFPLAHIKMRYKNKTQVLNNKGNHGRKNNKVNNKRIKCKINQLNKKLPSKSNKSRKCKLTDNLKENIITVTEFIANSVKNLECGDKETKSCTVEKTLNDSDIMPTLEKVSPVSSEKSEDACPILSPIVDNTSKRVAPLLLKPNCALNITPLLDPKLFQPEIEENLNINLNPKKDFEEPKETAAIEMETEVKRVEINKKQDEKQRTICVIASSDLDKKDLAQTEINDVEIPIVPTNNECIISNSLKELENTPAKLIKSPTKRKSKKLNDCIAMLTDKLQSKLSDNHINSFNVLQSFLLEPLVKNSDPVLICNDKQNSSVPCNEKLEDLLWIKQPDPAAAINPVEDLHEIVSIPTLDIVNDKIDYKNEQQLMHDKHGDDNYIKGIPELKVTIEENVEMVNVSKLSLDKSDETDRADQDNIHFKLLKEIEVIHKEGSSPQLQGHNIIDGITTQKTDTIEKMEQESARKENILDQVLLKQNEEKYVNMKSSDEIVPNVNTSKIKKLKKTQTKKTEKIMLPSKKRKNKVPKTVLESIVCENSSAKNLISTIVDNEIGSVIHSTSTHLDGSSEQENETHENHQVNSILSKSNEVLENGIIDLKKEMISSASKVTLENFESTDSQNENASNSNELFISGLSANDEQYIQNALEIPNLLLNSNDEVLNDLNETNKSLSKAKTKRSRKINHIVASIDNNKVLERSPVSSRKSTPRKCKFSSNVTNIENEAEDLFLENFDDDRKVDLSSKKKEKIRKYKKKISPFNDCSLIANEQLLSKTILLEDQLESDIQESLEIIADANDDKTTIEKTLESETETEISNVINLVDIAFDAKKSPTVLENDSDIVSNLLNVIDNVELDVNKSHMVDMVVEKDSNICDNSNTLTKYEIKDNETNFVMKNGHVAENEKSDTDIENVQNINNDLLDDIGSNNDLLDDIGSNNDLLDDIGVNVKSNNVENSDSEEDICLAVIAKILQSKPEISNDDMESCSTDIKQQHQEIDVQKENDNGKSLCAKILHSETISDSMNDTIEITKTRKKRRSKKSVLCNTRKNKQIKSEKIPETLVNDLLNYCEICKKSFQRIESLNKHKMTITHIAKLSEIEFFSRRNLSQVNILNDMSELNEVKSRMDEEDCDKTIGTETSIKDKSEKLSVVPPLNLLKEFEPHLEILNDVEEVDGENINSLENSVGEAVNELVDINNRKALSVEEALFFECCSLLKSSEATKSEMAPQPKSLSVNPYPILPSSAEVQSLKLNHYSNKFSDISSDSNNLPTIQHMDLPKLQEDSCGSNLTAFLASVDQFINTPLVNHTENNVYSPISNDANFSPISNAGSPNKSDCFETEFKLQEPSQTINNFSPISDQSDTENVTCNIYTKTISTMTLQETYIGSDEICDIAKDLRSPHLDTNSYKSREELYSVENMIVHSNSSFSDMGDSCPPSLANSVEDSETLEQKLPELNQLYTEKSDLLLRNEQARIHDAKFGINDDLKYKRIQESELREIDSNSSLPSSPHSNKKIPTKGALKVFESLKVSIPTSEFNLKKVISSCANSKLAAFVEIALQSEQSNEPFSNEQYEDNEFTSGDGKLKNNNRFLNNGDIAKNHKETYLCEYNINNEPKEKQEINHSKDIISVTHTIKVKEISPKRQTSPRKQDYSMLPNSKKKNLVLKFGNNLGFRIKKKRVNDKRKHKTGNKNNNKSSNKLTIKDIYDFEDSEDNVDFSTNKLASYVSNKFSSKCDFLNTTNIEIQQNGDNQKDSSNIPVSDGDDDDDGFDYLSDHLTDISSIESSEVVKPRIDTEGNPKQLIVGKIFRKNLKEKPEKPNLDELFDNLLSENIENPKCEEIEIKGNENDNSKVISDISTKKINTTEKEYNNEDNLKHKDLSKDQNNGLLPLKMKARKNRSKSTIEQELGMSFQQIKEIIGFAQRKSQRKCTTGKQNVLAENWSSDEDFGSRNKKDRTKLEKRFAKEHVDQKLHIKSQIKSEVPIAVIAETDIPTSSEAVQNVLINNKSDQNKQISKDLSISCKENDVKETNSPIEKGFSEIRDNLIINNGPTRIKRTSHRSLAEDSSSDSECDSKKKKSRKARRRRRLSSNLKEHQAKLNTYAKDLTSSQNESIASKGANNVMFHDNALVETLASKINVEKLSCNNKRSKQNPTDLDAQTAAILSLPRRKRVSTDMLYYWSSSSDEDQYAGMIEVKPIRDDVNLTEHPIQHGWIVGDSHKKLVTLLAHAKGKKTEDCVVKESNIKKNRHTL